MADSLVGSSLDERTQGASVLWVLEACCLGMLTKTLLLNTKALKADGSFPKKWPTLLSQSPWQSREKVLPSRNKNEPLWVSPLDPSGIWGPYYQFDWFSLGFQIQNNAGGEEQKSFTVRPG